MIDADDVIARIARHGRVESWGPTAAPIDDVVVCWSATAEAISAAAGTATLLICRAHPLSASPTRWDPGQLVEGDSWDARSAGDAVIDAKRALIASSGIAIAWAPAWWDLERSRSLAYVVAGRPDAPVRVVPGGDGAVLVDITPTPFGGLVDRLMTECGARHALTTGDDSTVATRVGCVAGIASPDQIAALVDAGAEAIVAGETVEWEGAPFLQDLHASGRHVVFAALGTATTEQLANAALARRIAEDFPALRVRAISHADPTWTPEDLG